MISGFPRIVGPGRSGPEHSRWLRLLLELEVDFSDMLTGLLDRITASGRTIKTSDATQTSSGSVIHVKDSRVTRSGRIIKKKPNYTQRQNNSYDQYSKDLSANTGSSSNYQSSDGHRGGSTEKYRQSSRDERVARSGDKHRDGYVSYADNDQHSGRSEDKYDRGTTHKYGQGYSERDRNDEKRRMGGSKR